MYKVIAAMMLAFAVAACSGGGDENKAATESMEKAGEAAAEAAQKAGEAAGHAVDAAKQAAEGAESEH
jgi:hypothetical protein